MDDLTSHRLGGEPANPLDDIAAPNCAECLTQLEVAGSADHPYWWCRECRVARLT